MALTKIDDRGLKTPIDLLDNEKIRFGTGNDLELYHDGTQSQITESGTGLLYINSNVTVIRNSAGGENQITAEANGSVGLYYDNVKKLETKSNGVHLADRLFLDDSNKLTLGNGDDLQLYHDGTYNWIDGVNNHPTVLRAGTNELYLQGSNVLIGKEGASEFSIKAISDGAAELY